VPGRPHEETEATHRAAARWVSAVNHFGQMGQWAFHVCWDPQLLGAELEQVFGA